MLTAEIQRVYSKLLQSYLPSTLMRKAHGQTGFWVEQGSLKRAVDYFEGSNTP